MSSKMTMLTTIGYALFTRCEPSSRAILHEVPNAFRLGSMTAKFCLHNVSLTTPPLCNLRQQPEEPRIRLRPKCWDGVW